MKKYRIGILGATGAVGQEMLKMLDEYNIPIEELRLLASARSAGTAVKFKGEDVILQEATDSAFDGLDFVLGAVEGDMSKKFAPAIKASGAVISTTAPLSVSARMFLSLFPKSTGRTPLPTRV